MKIAYRSPFVPAEWLEAHGVSPLRYVPSGHKVPAGPLRAEEGICPFLRAWINEVAASDHSAILADLRV